MISRILEVGVAVKDLLLSGRQFVGVLGAEAGTVVGVGEFDMNMQMFRVGNVDFELMEPVRSGGTIEKFLVRRGEGLHHIAFQVDNMADGLHWMKEHSVKIINEKPVLIDGLKAVFLHPESFGGVLFELIEGSPTWVGGRVLPDGLQDWGPTSGVRAQGITEVGIVVRNLDAAASFYSQVFSAEKSESAHLDDLSIRVGYLFAGNVRLKLMEVFRTGDHLAEVFGETRPGLHHVTLKVDSIEVAKRFLKSRGIQIVEDPGASSFGVNSVFLQPKTFSEVLIQLKERYCQRYI